MPKIIKRLGSLTSLRSGTAQGTPNSGGAGQPTSQDFARAFMNFRFNHLVQRNTRPQVPGRGSAGGVDWSSCNRSGTAPVYGVGNAPGTPAPAGPVNDAGVVRVNQGD